MDLPSISRWRCRRHSTWCSRGLL